MGYQAVIFDLDGTLLDTIEDIAIAVNQVLERNDFPVHKLEHYREIVGLGLEQLISDVLPESARDAETIKRISREAGEAYGMQWKVNTKPFSGVQELLQQIKEKELKLAVLSNKPQRFTEACVSALLGNTLFDVVMGAREDIPKKPAPDGALKIAEMLQVTPGQTLYVGDSGTDMQTAQAAGMFAAGVSWGFRSETELWKNGAKAVIHEPHELLALLV